jgi:hypothetical protein
MFIDFTSTPCIKINSISVLPGIKLALYKNKKQKSANSHKVAERRQNEKTSDKRNFDRVISFFWLPINQNKLYRPRRSRTD